jgi:hypothetical protein
VVLPRTLLGSTCRQPSAACHAALVVSAASASLSSCVSSLNMQVGLGLNIQTGDQFARGQQSEGAMPAGQRENGGANAPADRDEPQPSAAEPQSTPEPMDEQSEEEKVIGRLVAADDISLLGTVWQCNLMSRLESAESHCACLLSCSSRSFAALVPAPASCAGLRLLCAASTPCIT